MTAVLQAARPAVGRRAVTVTGIGVVAPTGLGLEAHWQATLRGASGIDRVTRFDPSGYPAVLAGQVPDFEAEQLLPKRLLPQTDHMTRLALLAGDWALSDAGLPSGDTAVASDERGTGVGDDDDDDPSLGMGVVTANCAGGFEFGQNELQNLWRRGSRFVSAYQSFAWFYAVNSGQLSIRNGLRGPGGVLVSDQAGGLDAVAHARRQLRKGSRLMMTGGVDAAVCPWGWVAQLADGRMSTVAQPDRAYLPFDAEASGYVPGEGGALLVLEPVEAARARNAPQSYGEIAGYGSTFDPRAGAGRPRALASAIRAALADAGERPDGIDVVFADAAGDIADDAAEAATLNEVFGPGAVPVTAPKTMTGRLGSGGPALDVATALLAIRDGVIPAGINVVPRPELGLDMVVGAPREAALRTALVVARGRGGFNSAMVVRAPR